MTAFLGGTIAVLAIAAIITIVILGVRYADAVKKWNDSEAARRDADRDLGTARADVDAANAQVADLKRANVELDARCRRAEAAAIIGLPDDQLRNEVNRGADPRAPGNELLPFPAGGHPEPAPDSAVVPAGEPAPGKTS